MNFAVILLGANLGDKQSMFVQVAEMLSQHIGTIVKKSSYYQSSAWGFESEDKFLNQVVVVETEFSAHDTLLRCQAIETKCGRTRSLKSGYESRVIDIDILYFNNDIVDSEDLVIPHPLLQQRRFALMPLVEVLPEYIHPILMKPNSQLLYDCPDDSFVEKV